MSATSLPAEAIGLPELAALARAPLVLGTTGLPEDIEADLARAAVRIPLLVAPNTSLGVALLQRSSGTISATVTDAGVTLLRFVITLPE